MTASESTFGEMCHQFWPPSQVALGITKHPRLYFQIKPSTMMTNQIYLSPKLWYQMPSWKEFAGNFQKKMETSTSIGPLHPWTRSAGIQVSRGVFSSLARCCFRYPTMMALPTSGWPCIPWRMYATWRGRGVKFPRELDDGEVSSNQNPDYLLYIGD